MGKTSSSSNNNASLTVSDGGFGGRGEHGGGGQDGQARVYAHPGGLRHIVLLTLFVMSVLVR